MENEPRSSRGEGNIFAGIVSRSQKRKAPVKLGWGMIVLLAVVGLFVMFGLSMKNDDTLPKDDARRAEQGPDPDELMTTPWAESDAPE